jgi:preprotein translocase subunit YajC
MLYALTILAEEGTKQKSPDGGLGSIIFLLPIILILYLVIVVLPGRRRQEKDRQSLLSNTKKNDEVLTIGGIYGTVVSVSDTKDEVTVKVDDGTRLRMTKSSIMRNITAEEAAKAAQTAPKTQEQK